MLCRSGQEDGQCTCNDSHDVSTVLISMVSVVPALTSSCILLISSGWIFWESPIIPCVWWEVWWASSVGKLTQYFFVICRAAFWCKLDFSSFSLPESHTAEHLADAIKECLGDWNIEKFKISCITVDNAFNIIKGVKQILEWPYLPCFGHTLNLALKAGFALPRVQKVVSKCLNIVTYFRKFSKAMYILNKNNDLSVQHSLI